jgi:hypothetical protein
MAGVLRRYLTLSRTDYERAVAVRDPGNRGNRLRIGEVGFVER